MPSYGVSSTIFGSIRIILTSSGVARESSETSIELTKLDLPEPVEPATRQVRHLREVGRDEVALDVLAEADDQRVVVAAGGRVGEHVGQPNHLAVGVGNLDADGGLAGDRREHPDALGGHGVGDVLLQRRDLLDLHAGSEFDLVAGDGRAAGAPRDGGIHLELVQDRLDDHHHLVVGGAAQLRRIACDEQIQRRQRVRALDDPVEFQRVLLLGGLLASRRASGRLRDRRLLVERVVLQRGAALMPAGSRSGPCLRLVAKSPTASS